MKKHIITLAVLLLLDIGALYWMCYVHIAPVSEILVSTEADGTTAVSWDKDRRPVEYCIYGSDDGETFLRIGETQDGVWRTASGEDIPGYLQIRKKYMGLEGKRSPIFATEEDK